MGPNCRRRGIQGCGVMCLAKMFVASDCPWLCIVVDYSDFVSYCFSNKGLRPEL